MDNNIKKIEDVSKKLPEVKDMSKTLPKIKDKFKKYVAIFPKNDQVIDDDLKELFESNHIEQIVLSPEDFDFFIKTLEKADKDIISEIEEDDPCDEIDPAYMEKLTKWVKNAKDIEEEDCEDPEPLI